MDRLALPLSPYKGLIPYSEADEPYFFGRDTECEIITSNLQAARITALYGASGVGKSSVLRAGVMSRLRRLAEGNMKRVGKPRFCLAIYPWGETAQSAAYSSWRDDPVDGIGGAVIEAASRYADENARLALRQANSLCDRLRAAAESVGGRMLIILDQFEEFFLYHAGEAGGGTFGTEFPAVVNDPELRVNFLIGIREDAIAKLDFFKAAIPHLLDNRLEIKHLSPSAAREAVEKPLLRYNERVAAPGEEIQIEPELVERVLRDVELGKVSSEQTGKGVIATASAATESGQTRLETPYLQLVINRLWLEERTSGSRVLRLATLTGLGGVEGIVQGHLRDSMERLASAEERELAAQVFHYLVTPSGAKIAQTAFDLASYTQASPERLIGFLEKLSHGENRLLRAIESPGDPQGVRYEIFHDVLACPVLEWSKRYFEEKKQEEIQAKRRAEQKAALDRRKRWVVLGFALLLPFAVVGWQWAIKEGDQANARWLAAESRGQVQRDPKLALYLATAATESMGAAKTEALQALDEALNVPIPVEIKTCVTAPVSGGTVVRFVDHGRVLAIGCYDGVVKMYDASSGKRRTPLKVHGEQGGVWHLAFSRDRPRAVTWDAATIRVWDLRARRPKVSLELPAPDIVSVDENARFVITVAEGDVTVQDLDRLNDRNGIVLSLPDVNPEDVGLSRDGKLLGLITKGDLELCEVERCGSRTKVKAPVGHPFVNLLISPGKQIVAATDDYRVMVYDRQGKPLTEDPLRSIEGINGVTFSEQGLAIVGQEVRVWKQDEDGSLSEQHLAAGDAAQSSRMALSPDLRYAAIATVGRVTLWDFWQSRPITSLPVRGDVKTIVFSDDGKRLATLEESVDSPGQESIARIWRLADVGGGVTLDIGEGAVGQGAVGERAVKELAFSKDEFVLAGATPYQAKLWDWPSGEQPAVVRVDPESGNRSRRKWTDVALNPEARLLAAAEQHEAGSRLVAWDFKSRRRLPLPALEGVVEVAFSLDGGLLAVGKASGEVRIFAASRQGLSDRSTTVRRKCKGGELKRLLFSPTAQHLAITSEDHTTEIWSTTKQPIRLFPVSAAEPSGEHVAFSRDGRRLAMVQTDDKIGLFRLRAESIGNPRLLDSPLENDRPRRLAFSPDGELLAVGGEYGNVVLLDLESEKAQALWTKTLAGRIEAFAFNRESNQVLITSSDDAGARLWDARTGDELRTFFSGEASVGKADFSPDGRYLAFGREDGSIRIYPLRAEDRVKIAANRLRGWIPAPWQCERYMGKRFFVFKRRCPALDRL